MTIETNAVEFASVATEATNEVAKGFFASFAGKVAEAASQHPVGAAIVGTSAVAGALFGGYKMMQRRKAEKEAAAALQELAKVL